ncbi:YDG/SRA domain-containing protein [Amycolatopsis sp. NPDC005232]|uniref:YDG/SRA domain-containing protein n=1 Tax=Amycolatopsis sp. NPDC005232 TaxID=3157027 RepID=UPI0033B83B0C
MSLGDIEREHVLAAATEYDQLGKENFLNTYGFKHARRYEVLIGEWAYDSPAIAGVAHRGAMGSVLSAAELSAGLLAIVARLTALGFEVIDRETAPRFGEIPKVPEKTIFPDRRAVAARGTHRALQSGIVGTENSGAESIVVSGGYEDRDYGEVIIYTGHGGLDKNGKRIGDQNFGDPGNAALRTSMRKDNLVRVIRGAHKGSEFGPASGYRYEGLYQVDSADYVRNGRFWICQFRMKKALQEPDVIAAPPVPVALSGVPAHGTPPAGTLTPGRRTTVVQRTVRITNIAKQVKRIHDDTCQMCGVQLVVGDGTYSEGAHIQALGGPHDGPDVMGNILCLCPNCHVQFDQGAVVIQDDFIIQRNGVPDGALRRNPNHDINLDYIVHHRQAHGRP